MSARTRHVDALEVRVFDTVDELAQSAALDAAAAIRDAVEARGRATVMLATGNSQLQFLAALVQVPDLPWNLVDAFHMDEYVGLSPDHSASFQRYMRERVAAQLPVRFHYLTGDTGDAEAEARRYEALLAEHPLDVCCCGIGENGHLAFNDPPVADFDDPRAVKVIALEAESRKQQVGEGHFADLDAVPTHAITVTIPALLAAQRVLAIVPEARKAAPVCTTLTGPISTACPASVLRRQAHATLYLDTESAARVT